MKKFIKPILLVIVGSIITLIVVALFSASNTSKAEKVSEQKAQYDQNIAKLRMDCNNSASESIKDTSFDKVQDMKNLYELYYDACIRGLGQEPNIIKNLDTNILYEYE